MQRTVVSTAPLPKEPLRILPADVRVLISPSPDPTDVRNLLDERTAAIIARSTTPIGVELMVAAARLAAIGRTGAGFDSVDVQAATQRGIPVLYTPGALTRPTGEHTLCLILAALKDLPQRQDDLRAGRWEERNRRLNRDLDGCTVGIVGFGRIGRQVARLLLPFGCRLLAADPYLDEDPTVDSEIRLVPLVELLQAADIVTLHAPLTAETRGLINPGTLSLMRRGSILVNAARGGLIESNSLIADALDSGQLAAAALDVFETEPPAQDDPLLHHPRAIVTPHVGGRTPNAQDGMVRTLMEDLAAILAGSLPRLENVVNPSVFSPSG